MARPRIFISSTYYDLKSVRADLERYIRDRGFDPVLNERGQIPYGGDAALEEYCYEEIENCDILIAIIGGRFGSSSSHGSSHGPYSISQKELKTAITLGRPVYIFVEKSVFAEHKTYERNKNKNNNIEYVAVDNVSIYRFIDEVLSLPLNNPLAPFETSSDVIEYLQEQWSGLFQRLLREASRRKEVVLLEELKTTAKALEQLVSFLTKERRAGDQAIKGILLPNHPIFESIRRAARVPYRVFFTNRKEMNTWLKTRRYRQLELSEYDSDTRDSHEEWVYDRTKPRHLLKIAFEVFGEDGKLKIFTPDEWRNDLIMSREIEKDDENDDVPF